MLDKIKMVESNGKVAAPAGFKVLTEGQANILYIEEKMEVDD